MIWIELEILWGSNAHYHAHYKWNKKWNVKAKDKQYFFKYCKIVGDDVMWKVDVGKIL